MVSVQVVYWLLVYILHCSCMVLLLPWKLHSWHSSFSNAVSMQLSDDAFSEKMIHNGPIVMKLYVYQPVLGENLLVITIKSL